MQSRRRCSNLSTAKKKQSPELNWLALSWNCSLQTSVTKADKKSPWQAEPKTGNLPGIRRNWWVRWLEYSSGVRAGFKNRREDRSVGILWGGGDKGSGLRKGRTERKTSELGAQGNIHTVYTSKSKPWGILSCVYGQDAKTKVQLLQTLRVWYLSPEPESLSKELLKFPSESSVQSFSLETAGKFVCRIRKEIAPSWASRHQNIPVVDCEVEGVAGITGVYWADKRYPSQMGYRSQIPKWLS